MSSDRPVIFSLFDDPRSGLVIFDCFMPTKRKTIKRDQVTKIHRLTVQEWVVQDEESLSHKLWTGRCKEDTKQTDPPHFTQTHDPLSQTTPGPTGKRIQGPRVTQDLRSDSCPLLVVPFHPSLQVLTHGCESFISPFCSCNSYLSVDLVIFKMEMG